MVVRPSSDGHLPEILLPRDDMDVQSLAGHSPNERQSVEPGHTQKYEKQLFSTGANIIKVCSIFKSPNFTNYFDG